MKAAFNQEKALVGTFSVITNIRMDLFQALLITSSSRKARKEMTVSVGVAPGLAVTQHTAIDTVKNIGLT